MFKLEIQTGNAAFEGSSLEEEIGRILYTVADRVQRGGNQSGLCKDLNGNTVGEWSITDEA